MATPKKKAIAIVQKPKSKTATKKASPVKKVTTKKPIPVKKTVVSAKKAPIKKVIAKKAAVKVAVKKATTKPVTAKKALAKKIIVKKPLNTKSASSKKIAKKAPIKKAAPKLSKGGKALKPIIKHSPVKKTAKTGAIKAVPKKLATPKKAAVKKPAVPVKKIALKKTNESIIKHTTAKSAKQKPVEKVAAEPETIISHKAELKKALSKMKANKQEPKKSEKPFVMPKTHTEKSRKYEPEFVKSVLDQTPEEYNGPTMRYSDSELVEFRDLISRKLETAKKELGYLQGLITRKDQMGGDDADNRYMTMEDGGLSMEREQLSQMASRQITFIDHLEKAMMRIENKTYGICRVTGKLIDKARLRAVPHATLSIEAKMGIVKAN
ncbi:MAG: TraR/DksA C4-type zinc finger protein [Ginsengibacter sp.]